VSPHYSEDTLEHNRLDTRSGIGGLEERHVNRHAKGTPDRRRIGTLFVTSCVNPEVFLCSADMGPFLRPGLAGC
jgi:hypothetical protein